ncbi:yiaA/B two helix domain family protein [Ruegeria sp. R11]|nr:yiaA/B two helix domain family protein [Ruegeria sp. R11]
MTNARNDNNLIITLNVAGVAVAFGMLGISLWLSTEVPLATKGFWGMGIMLLTLSLINLVKYRFDIRSSEDRIRRIEEARNEKMLEEALTDSKPL